MRVISKCTHGSRPTGFPSSRTSWLSISRPPAASLSAALSRMAMVEMANGAAARGSAQLLLAIVSLLFMRCKALAQAFWRIRV